MNILDNNIGNDDGSRGLRHSLMVGLNSILGVDNSRLDPGRAKCAGAGAVTRVTQVSETVVGVANSTLKQGILDAAFFNTTEPFDAVLFVDVGA